MKQFKGKTAFWFYAIVVIYNIAPLRLVLQGESKHFWFYLFLLVYYVGDLIFIPVIFHNSVDLYEDHFIVHYGFSNETFFLSEITEIKKSKSFVASSANSLDRIYINTKNKEIYISLKENDAFLTLVKQSMENNI